MNFIETFKTAIHSLGSNKLRSLLTMLGIIIGISSVIAMSAIGKGGQEKITGSLSKSGFGVYEISVDIDSDNYKSAYSLKSSDIDAISDLDNLEAVSPSIRKFVMFKDSSNSNLRGMLYGTNSGFEKIDQVTYLMGRPILEIEYEEKIPVIVIDNITAKRIFKNETPLGKKIGIEFREQRKIRNFTIVGVFEHPDAGMNQIGLARFMPSIGRISMPLMERLTSTDDYSDILVKALDPSKAQALLGNIITVLETKNTSDIYEYEENVSRGSSFREVLSTLNIFVTFVASISLMVGGIGVMNIMLVSVTERIKEIGIRKAIGAKNRDILFQFMTEAVVLSISGGIIGILFGYIVSQVFGLITGISPIISHTIVLVSVFISTLIGVIFGVYPAKQASLMNPIDALRNE